MDGQLILDRYRPLSTLGEGGYGVVELAWDTRMQRRVAIKRLPVPAGVRDRSGNVPGLAEARTAAMLNHPAIVTVFDFDTDSDEAFLVMEYVDGASLADILDHVDGALTLDEAAAVLDAVSSALEFAHDNGVLHLDIKPENVLIARDGRVKVADFGLAELSSVTGHGAAYGGTPGYMPLEQVSGSAVSARSDQWALAAVIFECLSGTNPFAELTPQAAVVKLEAYEPPLLSDYARDVDKDADEVMGRALSNTPSKRYGHAGDFTQELLPLLGDPAAGRISLSEIVDELSDETLDPEPGYDEVGIWDRLRGRAGSGMVRLVAAVESGWLAWSGLAPWGLELPAGLAATGLVVVAGLLAPSLGIALGLGCLIAGVFKVQAWIAGAALLVGGVSWWWFIARRNAGAAVLPLSAPILAAIRLAPAQPLIAGFSLRPLAAAVTALFGGVLAMLASAVSSHGAPYLDVWAPYVVDVWRTQLAAAGVTELLASPAAYVALLGWPLSATIMSWACSRATRAGAIVGAVGGTAAFVGMYYTAGTVSQLLGDETRWMGSQLIVSAIASLILMVLVSILGAPLRPEEDPAHDAWDGKE